MNRSIGHLKHVWYPISIRINNGIIHHMKMTCSGQKDVWFRCNTCGKVDRDKTLLKSHFHTLVYRFLQKQRYNLNRVH